MKLSLYENLINLLEGLGRVGLWHKRACDNYHRRGDQLFFQWGLLPYGSLQTYDFRILVHHYSPPS